MRRLAVTVIALIAVTASLAGGTPRRPSVVLDRTAAAAGDPVRARVGIFAPMRLYLVALGIAGTVRGRFDSRIHFVAEPRPDARARMQATFTVPPLASGTYAVGIWCPGCRPAFIIPRRPSLRVTMPAAASEACPVSRPNGPERRYGNGLLSSRLPPDGLLRSPPTTDGSLFNKIWWVPSRGIESEGWLTVSGRRLDAPSAPLRLLDVNWGGAGSWASAVEFPGAGCWRLTGKVADIKLSYVLEVVPA